MHAFFSFLEAWADRAFGLFGSYPLSASCLVALLVWAFVALDGPGRKGWGARTLRFQFLLIVFLIIAPILSVLLPILGDLWDAISETVEVVVSAGVFAFRVYQAHPVLVLLLLAITGLVFFIWNQKKPRRPSRPIKALSCIALFMASVAAAAPVADVFAPPNTSTGASVPSSPSANDATVSTGTDR